MKRRGGPSTELFKPGIQVRLCRRCNEVIQERTYNANKKRFAVKFCSLGIPLSDLIEGGAAKYLLTPVDLKAEGRTDYPMIANHEHVVGTLSILIAGDDMTLSYKLNDERSEILSQSIRFFEDIADLNAETVAKRSASIKFDVPFSISKKFSSTGYVLLSINCDGIYDVNSSNNPAFEIESKVYEHQVSQMKKILPEIRR